MGIWEWILLLLILTTLVLSVLNRATGKRLGEDIDELRSSLFELRTGQKLIRSQWNRKISEIHVELLHLQKKIPENRIPYLITQDCIACGSCLPECPVNAITEGPIYEIHPALCIACKKCAEICPVGACVPMKSEDAGTSGGSKT